MSVSWGVIHEPLLSNMCFGAMCVHKNLMPFVVGKTFYDGFFFQGPWWVHSFEALPKVHLTRRQAFLRLCSWYTVCDRAETCCNDFSNLLNSMICKNAQGCQIIPKLAQYSFYHIKLITVQFVPHPHATIPSETELNLNLYQLPPARLYPDLLFLHKTTINLPTKLLTAWAPFFDNWIYT